MSRRGALLLIASFCALIVCVSPPQALVSIGPAQSVSTSNPKLGVHTRLTDEVEEWKIQRTLQMVREMGASWIVEYFPWAYSEPRKGHYDFWHADMVINHARAQGLTVIARVDLVPEWARPAKSPSQLLLADHYGDYGDFISAFVTHFRGRIGYLQVWNEPNLTNEWGGRTPSAAEYTNLLAGAYRRAKEADPQIVVLAGALAPTLEGDASRSQSDISYLTAMYEAGAAAHFDALAIHAYGRKAPPASEASAGAINFRRAELLRKVMVEWGDGNKTAYVTEGGWNDHPRWAYAVRSAQRIDYSVESYRIARDEWDWCLALALWAFRFPAEQHSVQDYYSFVTPQFVPKPIYGAIQAAFRK